IHLLAAAYAYSQRQAKKTSRDSSQETITFDQHAEAIARFALGHINRLLSKKDYDNLCLIYKHQETEEATMKWTNAPLSNLGSTRASKQVVSVLTLLLDRPELKDANHSFAEGLLKLDSGTWVPYPDVDLNPIVRAIKNKDERLLKSLIEYCINCAKKHHPAYLVPVEQCLAQLSKDYPEIVANVFISTSYIPAHNYEYVASHAICTNNKIQNFFGNNKNPVFILRSQLPTTTWSSYFFMNINRDLHRGSESRFPKFEVQPAHKKPNYKIYVSPFQFKPIEHLAIDSKTTAFDYIAAKLQNVNTKLLQKEPRKESIFAHIERKEHFDNPVIAAIIRFKWYKFVIKYWWQRFFMALVFFVLMMAITAKQIAVSSREPNEVPTPDKIAARYLPEWRPVFIMAIAFGLMLIVDELWQMWHSPKKYLRSPFNYVSLEAFVSSVVGCFLALAAESGIRDDTGVDGGPRVLVLELRVIRHLGVTVNIILNITKRVFWFMLIFGLFLVAFTHSLLPCTTEPCVDTEDAKLPTGFFRALTATCFFLAGRFDPIDKEFYDGTTGFSFMMVVFYFFSAILLLNILIAHMNDAFNESAEEGEIAHLRLLSGVIAEKETHVMTKAGQERGDYYPKRIYYGASEEEAARFHSKYSITDVSTLSAENRFVVETSKMETTSIRETMTSIRETMNDNIVALRRDTNDNIMTLRRNTDDELAMLKVLLVGQTKLIETLLRKVDSLSNQQSVAQ
ncbi:hypothetical protein BGZ65_011995, partial [Modicella reniformis]